MATAAAPSGPFTYTAPGDLGVHRETMLSNELLLRDKVGQPKTRGFYLPGRGFTYGRPNDRRDLTAADALRGWGGGSSSLPFDRPQKQPDRDFMALNRSAVSAGLVTAKENFDFRATHDIRRKPSATETGKKSRTRRLPPSMVFGLPTRPSTPIYDLLEHKFQDKWISQQRSQEFEKRQKETQQKNQMKVYDTRATLLRTFQNPVDDKSLWQLPRFTKSAKPHLQTFRSSKAKEDAFKNFELDRVSRKGVLGQGVYESAKN
ncbi:cilia- and flagella-associated protein 77-like isoform X2 [Babylonia areolata]|uniref:cilia- and flagella-associated protein 77-like isoform X2 n=1 Tax=Babylonia areolata TaxID=304850 RepID=UPI003FD589E6